MLMPRTAVPALAVPTLAHGAFTLAQDKPAQFTLVVFYRGLHCPICAKYLIELGRLLPEFEQRGVKVIGEIPAKLPPFGLPIFDGGLIREFGTSALAIALLGLLAGCNVWARDSTLSAMDTTAVTTSEAAAAAPGSSIWPMA